MSQWADQANRFMSRPFYPLANASPCQPILQRNQANGFFLIHQSTHVGNAGRLDQLIILTRLTCIVVLFSSQIMILSSNTHCLFILPPHLVLQESIYSVNQGYIWEDSKPCVPSSLNQPYITVHDCHNTVIAQSCTTVGIIILNRLPLPR